MYPCKRKTVPLTVVLLILGASLFGQKIENIKADQFREQVVITYDILNALPSETFLVKAECIVEGKSISMLHVSGNGVGRVKAGPSRQMIWEASKDVSSLESNQVYFKIIATPITESTGEEVSRGAPAVNQKARFLHLFTSSVDNYVEQVFNLVTTFETFGKRAFESRSDLVRLQNQVEKLNTVYEELQPSKEGFKQNIRSFYGSEAINCTSEAFLNRILDNMHRSYILTLNKVVKDINEVITNPKLKGAERAKIVQEIMIESRVRTSMLKEEVNMVKGDAKALYMMLRE